MVISVHATDHTRRYTTGEEIANAVTHGIAALMSIAGLAILVGFAVAYSGSPTVITAVSVFGASMIFLYVASTLYHAIPNPKAKRILQRLDHSMIYVLIAGSYTPICLGVLRNVGAWGWALFSVIWVLALAGIILTMGWINMPRQLTAAIYISMGWMAVVAIYPLYQTVGWAGLSWLLAGGVLYTVGGVSYALKWPGRDNPRFGCHEIFHVFIVLGSVCHFLLMYRVVCLL